MSIKDRIRNQDMKDRMKFGRHDMKSGEGGSEPDYMNVQRVDIPGITWANMMQNRSLKWFSYDEIKQQILPYAHDEYYFTRVYHGLEEFLRDVEEVTIFPSGEIHMFRYGRMLIDSILLEPKNRISPEVWKKVVDFARTNGGRVIYRGIYK